jgi:arabinose-5-phosphate isomerase
MSLETARKLLRVEAAAIENLARKLNSTFESALDLLAACQGRVVTTGMGKSGIVCRKIAATFSSTGTPALYLHPAEAIHGDLGMLAGGDAVVMLSNSGETEELTRLLSNIKRLAIPVVALVGRLDSTIGRSADVVLDVGVDAEACPFNLAPTASTTAALALGDALAIALSLRKGFELDEFARLHPGGKLGKRLARVGELMHRDEKIPSVSPETGMPEVIYEMSKKGLGIAAVVDAENRLLGVISDGDLRRLLQARREQVFNLTAGECMTRDPISVSPEEFAVAALKALEDRKITCLMVTEQGRLQGVLHLHDLWGTEMF